MEGARLPVWLVALAALFWGAAVAWRWTASRPEWRSVAAISLLAYLAMLGLQLQLPAPPGSFSAPLLVVVGAATAALASGVNSPRMLLAAWLTTTLLVSGALLAQREAAGVAMILILSAGGLLPWWSQRLEGESPSTSGAEQSAIPAPAPLATIVALTLLSVGVWGAVHVAASGEASGVSPSGRRSTLPRGIVSGTKPIATPTAPPVPPTGIRPELLGLVGLLSFAGLLGAGGNSATSPPKEHRHYIIPT